MPFTITGVVKSVTNVARANKKVVFTPLTAPAFKSTSPDELVTSTAITLYTGGAGDFSVSLLSGQYLVTVEDTDSFRIIVPTSGVSPMTIGTIATDANYIGPDSLSVYPTATLSIVGAVLVSPTADGSAIDSPAAVVSDKGGILTNDLRFSHLTANRAIYLDADKAIKPSVTTATELSYLSGAASNLQAQLDSWQLTVLATTTDATQTELLTAGSARLVVPSDKLWGFETIISARRSGSTRENMVWIAQGGISRATAANTVQMENSGVIPLVPIGSMGWTIDIDNDTTNGSLRIRVTGEAGKTILWKAIVRYTEV